MHMSSELMYMNPVVNVMYFTSFVLTLERTKQR